MSELAKKQRPETSGVAGGSLRDMGTGELPPRPDGLITNGGVSVNSESLAVTNGKDNIAPRVPHPNRLTKS